jgi:hypothetical protein
MPTPKDSHTWHDAQFGTGRLVELTPEQRKARTEFQRESSQAAGEAAQSFIDSVNKPRKPDVWDYAAVAANIEAGTIPTPAQERARKLGYELQPDGSLVSSKLAEAQKRQHEPEYEGGPTAAETAELEAYLAEDDEEDDAEFWHDE